MEEEQVVMNIRTVVDTFELFSQASPGAKTKILSYGKMKTYHKGEYLLHAREEAKCVYMVVAGMAALERVSRDGYRRVIFVLGPGQLLNEVVLEEAVSSVDGYALNTLEVVAFTREQFLEIMEYDFGFARLVMASMARKIRRLYRQIENTTKGSKLSRQVAARLWKLVRDFGEKEDDCVRLPFDLSITFLAGMVGSNRESVSRLIKDMTEKGILSISGGKCKVFDVKQLHEYGLKS